MSQQWKEVVRLQFKGQRFRDHALDVEALSELSRFQRIIAETAEALWHAANPHRERLPSHFGSRTRLCLRRIEPGSAAVPLEVVVGEQDQKDLWELELPELTEALDLAHAVFEAGERGSSLPEKLPRALVADYARWGESLAEGEELVLVRMGKRPVRVTAASRKHLAEYVEPSHQEDVNIAGEVLEADVKHRRFQLWLDETTPVTVAFSEMQEADVTTALKEHASLRLRVIGRGERSIDGRLLRVREVTRLQVFGENTLHFDPNARPIEDILAEIAAEDPSAWDKVPPDLSENLDRYLYGTPQK